jgi:hypothetical protein
VALVVAAAAAGLGAVGDRGKGTQALSLPTVENSTPTAAEAVTTAAAATAIVPTHLRVGRLQLGKVLGVTMTHWAIVLTMKSHMWNQKVRARQMAFALQQMVPSPSLLPRKTTKQGRRVATVVLSTRLEGRHPSSWQRRLCSAQHPSSPPPPLQLPP